MNIIYINFVILIIIQARTSSGRLPNKILYKFNKKTVIEILIDKLKKIKTDKRIIVATSNNRSDNIVAEISKKKKIECIRGSLNNVASRFKKVLILKKNYYYFTRISADSPLLDIKIFLKMLKKIKQEYDIITNVQKKTFPKGQSVEIIKTKFFLKNFKKIKSKIDKEHVTRKLYKIPSANIYNYLNTKNESRHSLALDTKKDLDFYKFFFKKKKLSSNFRKILNIRITYEKN